MDGLTKIPDQVTSRMLEKERAYVQQIERLHDHMRRMQKFVHTLIKVNNNNHNNNHVNNHSLHVAERISLLHLEYISTYGYNIPK